MKSKKTKKDKFIPGNFKLKVKRSRAGLGLFTLEEIPKKSCIIEYKGRVISEKEEYTSNSKYLFKASSKKTIDGRDRSNIARYINHSCRPNAEIELWDERIFVCSKRKIKEGEELCYDYGKEYFDEHIKNKGCRCKKCLEKKK